METVTDFIFLGSRITADGDCSHEIKSFLLGRKATTDLDNMLKSRDITLPTKVCVIKVTVFQQSCMDVRVDHKEGHEVKVEGVSLQQADSLQSEPTEKPPKG